MTKNKNKGNMFKKTGLNKYIEEIETYVLFKYRSKKWA